MAKLLPDLKKEADTAEPRNKVRLVETNSAEYTTEERELIRVLAKGMMAQEAQARLLKSLIECYRISTDQKVHSHTKKAMEQLIAAQKTLKEEGVDGPTIQERLGPAHGHVYNGLLAASLELASGEDKKILQRFADSISKVQDLVEEVKVCKIEPMHESKHKRLCIQIQERHRECALEGEEIVVKKAAPLCAVTVWPIMRRALPKDRAWKALPGVAPMGANARRCQKLLDALPPEE